MTPILCPRNHSTNQSAEEAKNSIAATESPSKTVSTCDCYFYDVKSNKEAISASSSTLRKESCERSNVVISLLSRNVYATPVNETQCHRRREITLPSPQDDDDDNVVDSIGVPQGTEKKTKRKRKKQKLETATMTTTIGRTSLMSVAGGLRSFGSIVTSDEKVDERSVIVDYYKAFSSTNRPLQALTDKTEVARSRTTKASAAIDQNSLPRVPLRWFDTFIVGEIISGFSGCIRAKQATRKGCSGCSQQIAQVLFATLALLAYLLICSKTQLASAQLRSAFDNLDIPLSDHSDHSDPPPPPMLARSEFPLRPEEPLPELARRAVALRRLEDIDRKYCFHDNIFNLQQRRAEVRIFGFSIGKMLRCSVAGIKAVLYLDFSAFPEECCYLDILRFTSKCRNLGAKPAVVPPPAPAPAPAPDPLQPLPPAPSAAPEPAPSPAPEPSPAPAPSAAPEPAPSLPPNLATPTDPNAATGRRRSSDDPAELPEPRKPMIYTI